MADQQQSPASPDTAGQQHSLQKREVLWAIAIIIGLAAAPAVGGVYSYYIENSAVDGLYGEALSTLQHTPAYADSLGTPIEARLWTREVVNYPTPEDDARVSFFVSSPNGDTHILARGRIENGKWTLTYLEVQPMCGAWHVDGEFGGFQREGRLKPIEI